MWLQIAKSKLDITDCNTNLKFHFGTSSQRSQVSILKKWSQNATLKKYKLDLQKPVL